jgi:exodeoxyribonuclease III
MRTTIIAAMRIATWNVNGLRARLEFLQRWLADRRPDIVGLQELKLEDESFPHEAFAELGYAAATHGQKAWNGVAVLAQRPLAVLQRGLPMQDAFGARLLTVEVEGLVFSTVYCPNGKSVGHADYALKLEWFDALVAHWRQCHPPAQPAILCGDFNIAPSDLDSWHPDGFETGIFHTPSERTRMAALLESGLVDCYRVRHRERRDFSWWDYRGGAFHRNMGLRIDLILASRPVIDRVREVEIDRPYRKKVDGLSPSDHAPVYADLDWTSIGV